MLNMPIKAILVQEEISVHMMDDSKTQAGTQMDGA